MNAPLPGDFKVTSPALAVGLVVATLVLLPTTAFAAWSTTIDVDVDAGDFREFRLEAQAGDNVKIDIAVQSGPRVDFFFVNQTELDKLNVTWPNAGQFDYFADFSSLNATSIHKTVTIPPGGFYYLVIANYDETLASAAGTISTTTQDPALLITIAVILISVGLVVALVVAVMVRRSFRSRLSHYSPPGKPTPPSLAHQHMQAQRQVVQQELGRPCPKCGYENSKGATLCSNCGAQL